ncbi:phage protease [Accumulibacter sp.]|uniref:phage protease n=1 Tax=Accumulibacter sp. TaxID=2053492 RepID=UPI002613A11D|nr:phage protease [Accumulibacter sp.]
MSRFLPLSNTASRITLGQSGALSAGLAALARSGPLPAVAALRSELASGPVPADVRLIPAGAFHAWDGRPTDVPAWLMTDADGLRLVAEMAAQQRDGYIDYEHATLHAKRSGQQAPAAGWYAVLEWRPGDGLWAVGIDWTDTARRQIAAREYRYISPLISYDPESGRVLRLLGASLTNDPAIDGLTDLAALAARYLLAPQPPTPENPPVNETLKKLLVALGVDETSDETAALAAALTAIQTIKASVVALTAQALAPDPAKFVPVGTLAALQGEYGKLQGQLAAANAKLQAGALEQVIEASKAAGKLTPALETWARDLGTRDLAALSNYLAAMPVVIVPGTTQTGGSNAGAAGMAALSADEAKVCQLLGVKTEDYLTTRKVA